MPTHIIEVKQVSKSFKKDRQQASLILDNISLALREGEVLALLGKSGSGKSTLLRMIAGLVLPSKGDVYYNHQKVVGPVSGISMVFQNFALMPWLTVLQNVELGLEALGIPSAERRKRALRAIDTIGLDGFESAYPKELSGGMRQRVGFARALVVEPDILLMDEPFSALDVLTADNLRSDLMDLWLEKKTRTRGIIIVTHNIEEAVLMADTIMIIDSNPGQIMAELSVTFPHPRNVNDVAFKELVDHIYMLMTRKKMPQARYMMAGQAPAEKEIGLHHRLPEVSVSALAGFMESLAEPENQGRVSLPTLAEELHMDVDDLFPLTETLEILRFARVSEGDIALTPAGRAFVEADILARKKIFLKHLIAYVPLAQHIRKILDDRSKHRVSEKQFLAELQQSLSEKEADTVLKIAIDWGRYAELFAYDYNAGELSLEDPN